MKKIQEQQAKAEHEKATVGKLNDKLNAAKAAADTGDYDTAIAALTEATQMDATRDLIWFKLADYYRLSAPKQTDPAEKQKRLDSAVESYQKAVDLKKATTTTRIRRMQAQSLAAYYNNLADAYAKARKIDDAVKTYQLAAQTDPSSVAQAYFNIGAVLTNSGRPDEANAAFDKCLAADPNRTEAYYQKGLNLLGKATLQGDKTIAPPGTAEAFQKYLELSPTGPNAQNAKDLLTTLGAKVETTYGTKKKPRRSSYFRIEAISRAAQLSRSLCVWTESGGYQGLCTYCPSCYGPWRGTVNYLRVLPSLWCVRFLSCEDEWRHQPLLRFPLR